MALARQIVISSQNEGPVVNIAAWVGMTIMILCVCTRLVSKYSVIRRLSTDDAFIGASVILAIAHTCVLSLAVANGLGSPQQTLSNNVIERFEQYAYASQLLYIPTLCLAKLSTLIYLRALSPDTPYAHLNLAIEIFIVLWALGAEFAIAFQCSLPTTWAILTTKCFDVLPFWNAIGTLDIVTDLAIIALPGYLVWSVQMSRSQKLLVFLVFGTRVLIIPLTILRMYFFNTSSSPSLPDQTLTSYHAYLATTIQLNAAIIIACLPFLKPFLESMSSGGFSSRLKQMDTHYATDSKYRKFSTISTFMTGKSTRTASTASGALKLDDIKLEDIPDLHFLQPEQPEDHHVKILEPSIQPRVHLPSVHFGWSGSQGDLGSLRPDKVRSFSHIGTATPEERSPRSSLASDKMIIKRTDAWEVQETYEVGDEITPVTDQRVRYDHVV